MRKQNEFNFMRIFLFLLSFVLVVPLHAQTADDYRNKKVIAANRVKNQISWDYKFTGEKPDQKGVKTSITTFSALGDVVQINALNPAGATTHSEKYTYDSKGNRTEYTRTSGDGSYQKKYIYNEKNLLTEESGFDGVENFKNQYVYNLQGDMTEIRYHKGSLLSEKRVFVKDGVTTTVQVYNRTGILNSRLVLIYDTRGNLIEESIYGMMSPDPLEKKTYNYDEKKKLKEEAKFKLNKITVRNTYDYNPSGSLLQITEESPGEKKYVKKAMTYNQEGNVTEIKWRRKSTEEFNRITYQYDGRGLCTSAETFYPATKYRVLTKYEYEYY
jgi:YD repeat-containing protein